MKKTLLASAAFLLLLGLSASAQINTVMYREMVRKHERMLEGVETSLVSLAASSTNAVQKTGDTISGPLVSTSTISAAGGVVAGNTIFLPGAVSSGFGISSTNFPATGFLTNSIWLGDRACFGLPAGRYITAIGARVLSEGQTNAANPDTVALIGDGAGLYYGTLASVVGVGDNSFSRGAHSNSVGIGLHALYGSTGIFCVAIGNQSGRYLTGPSTGVCTGNVAVGYVAMYQATGSYCVAIGRNAGRRAAGDYNIFIGSDNGYRTNTTSVFSNSINIGAVIDRSNQYPRIANNTAVVGNDQITNSILYGKLSVLGCPTSSVGLVSGDVWNDGGILKIVQ